MAPGWVGCACLAVSMPWDRLILRPCGHRPGATRPLPGPGPPPHLLPSLSPGRAWWPWLGPWKSPAVGELPSHRSRLSRGLLCPSSWEAAGQRRLLGHCFGCLGRASGFLWSGDCVSQNDTFDPDPWDLCLIWKWVCTEVTDEDEVTSIRVGPHLRTGVLMRQRDTDSRAWRRWLSDNRGWG